MVAQFVLLIVIMFTSFNEKVTEFKEYMKSLMKEIHLWLPLASNQLCKSHTKIFIMKFCKKFKWIMWRR
jgi:hypothetical protein